MHCKSLVRWQIESGIRFLVPTGSTGEACALLESEWLRLVSVVVEAAEGRVPIFVGCSHNTSQQAIARVKKLQAIPGVDGVLTANPYYTKPTQEGQYLHFRAIAENTHLQVLLYNIPSRTGINLLPETTARLAEIPNVSASRNPAEICSRLRRSFTPCRTTSRCSQATTIWRCPSFPSVA